MITDREIAELAERARLWEATGDPDLTGEEVVRLVGELYAARADQRRAAAQLRAERERRGAAVDLLWQAISELRVGPAVRVGLAAVNSGNGQT
jgi:hypothetical protein